MLLDGSVEVIIPELISTVPKVEMPVRLISSAEKDVATIDYWKDTEFLYQLECDVKKANSLYKQCIVEGYSEAF